MQNQEPNTKKGLPKIDEYEEEHEIDKELKKSMLKSNKDLSLNSSKSSTISSIKQARSNSDFKSPDASPGFKKGISRSSSPSGKIETKISKRVSISESMNAPDIEDAVSNYSDKNNKDEIDEIAGGSPKILAQNVDDKDNEAKSNPKSQEIKNTDDSPVRDHQNNRKSTVTFKKQSMIASNSADLLPKLMKRKFPKDSQTQKYTMKELEEQIREAAKNKDNIPIKPDNKKKAGVIDENIFEPSDDIDELSDVKNLDRWQHEHQDQKLMSMFGQKDEIYKQARHLQNKEQEKKQKEKEKEEALSPQVNYRLIDHIMEDNPQPIIEPTKTKLHSVFKNTNIADDENNEEDIEPSSMQSSQILDKKPLRGMESIKREFNKEIINELIMRKIKEAIPSLDEIDDSEENINKLRLKLKAIAQKTLGHFSSLKGFSSLTLLNPHIENLITKIKKKKVTYESLFIKNANGIDKNENDKMLDYKTVEGILMQKYKDSISNVQILRDKIKSYNHQCLELKNQIRELYKQKDEKDKYYEQEENKILTINKIPMRNGFNRRDNNASMLEDQLQIHKIRAEKKKVQEEILEKIMHGEDIYHKFNRELPELEQDISKYKNNKKVFKIQLRDLYTKILKDEAELLKKDNEIDYIWILKSLRNINENITENLLPPFLEKESAQFMIEYAILQYDLEKLCQENNLSGILALLTNVHVQIFTPENENITEPHDTNPYINIENIQVKDFNEMLDNVKQRLQQLKKQSIKIKKGSNDKGKPKGLPSKEEDQAIIDQGAKPSQDSQRNSKKNDNTKELSSVMKDANAKIDRATEMLTKLENMKKAEMNRLSRNFLTKNLDDRLILQFQKTVRLLFGKKEGDEMYDKFIKDKKIYDQKLKKTTKAKPSGSEKTFKKPRSIGESLDLASPIHNNSAILLTDTNISIISNSNNGLHNKGSSISSEFKKESGFLPLIKEISNVSDITKGAILSNRGSSSISSLPQINQSMALKYKPMN